MLIFRPETIVGIILASTTRSRGTPYTLTEFLITDVFVINLWGPKKNTAVRQGQLIAVAYSMRAN